MRYHKIVRTTLDLDDDLLQIARHLAAQRRTHMGQVISDLARKALESGSAPRTRNGVPLFTPKAGSRKPSLQLVNQLRDQP
jgi:hypothetical protein